MRIDFDLRPHDHATQVEWASLRGVHDRQAVRGTLIRAGDEHLSTGDRERVVAQSHTHDRVPDQAFRTTYPFLGLWFAAQLDRGERTQQSWWHVQPDRAECLIAVFAT